MSQCGGNIAEIEVIGSVLSPIHRVSSRDHQGAYLSKSESAIIELVLAALSVLGPKDIIRTSSIRLYQGVPIFIFSVADSRRVPRRREPQVPMM
jgi:hypothetical protein